MIPDNTKINWSNENEIRKLFTWLTKLGIGVRFNRPVSWYQIHQSNAIDVLVEKMGGHGEVRQREGNIEYKKDGKWKVLDSVNNLFREIDIRIRTT